MVDMVEGARFFKLLEIPMIEEEKEYPQYPAYADKECRKKMIPYGVAPEFDDSTYVRDRPEIVELYAGEYAICDC